jgi:phospholipid-binding lipoprotein MlaA
VGRGVTTGWDVTRQSGGTCVQPIGRPTPTAASLILAASLAGCAGAPAVLGPSYLTAPPQAEAAAPRAEAAAPRAEAAAPRAEAAAPRAEAAAPRAEAAAPQAEATAAAETPDPFEDVNRKIFAANQAFNDAVVYPIAKAYREDVPESVRDRVEAFSTNLSEPMVFANTVLQLRMDAAATTLARFVTNSTVGGLGLFDVATSLGQSHQTGDFGQTLYVWGVRDTAYLVLPVLGPSTVRDGIGTGVSLLAPFGVAMVVPTKFATATTQVNTVDAVGKPVADLGKASTLQEIEASSLDFYAMLRSVSDQKRQAELREAVAQSLFYPPEPAAPAGGDFTPVTTTASQSDPAPEVRAGLGGEPALRTR